jgi:hypothetical protein
MDDAALVCRRQPFGQLRSEIDTFPFGERRPDTSIALRDEPSFFDQEVGTVLRIKIVNGSEVRGWLSFEKCLRFSKGSSVTVLALPEIKRRVPFREQRLQLQFPSSRSTQSTGMRSAEHRSFRDRRSLILKHASSPAALS